MGEDNYLKLNSWKNYKELLNYKYIIFERNKEVKIEFEKNDLPIE